jgi:hypothetical protein
VDVKLCLITDDVAFAVEAEQAGIDRIMLDLERDGKAERQAGRGLFLSSHRIDSVARLKRSLEKATLVVRINPFGDRSQAEVDALADGGADFIMLPYFAGLAEARKFLELVRGRSRTILLVETASAARALEAIAAEPGVDEVHIGLNDLSISLGYDNLFTPICSGMIDEMAAVLRAARMPFGFGGIGRLSRRDLPVHPEHMLAEQIRLGASRGWLGRTFRGEMEQSRTPTELARELTAIRHAVAMWQSAPERALLDNRAALLSQAAAIGPREIVRAGVVSSTPGSRGPVVGLFGSDRPRTTRITRI